VKDWLAPIYAFFCSIPVLKCVEGCHCHVFQCAAKSCRYKSRGVRRYLDKSDAKSTGNMRKHARKCWGDETVASADSANNANEVCVTTVKGILDAQSIMAAFE